MCRGNEKNSPINSNRKAAQHKATSPSPAYPLSLLQGSPGCPAAQMVSLGGERGSELLQTARADSGKPGPWPPQLLAAPAGGFAPALGVGVGADQMF